MTSRLINPAALRRWRVRQETRNAALFALLVGPNLLLFAVFTYWPLVYNGYLSFVQWDLLAPVKVWVGLENYRFLFSSAEFGRILLNTFVFTAASVGFTCLLGLIAALLLNQKLIGRDAVRSIIFSPAMLSGAAIGIVWIYIFDPRYGLLDLFIRALGGRSPNWLLSGPWAMAAVVTVYVWKNLGYAVVIYLAGLQAIPRELYEAARVDGAHAWARLRHITLPGLSPVTFFAWLFQGVTWQFGGKYSDPDFTMHMTHEDTVRASRRERHPRARTSARRRPGGVFIERSI